MFSSPYPTEPYSPYWGTSTATENWCEEDYIITPYIAEYINTLSNILYIIISIYGIFRSNFRPSSALPHLGLLAVGILSALYHGSLKLRLQLGDSLSMVVATALVLYRLLTFQQPVAQQRQTGLLIGAAVVGFSIFHCVVNILAIHTVVFAGMIAFGTVKVRGLLGKLGDGEARRRVRRVGRIAEGFALAGFVLWGVDNLACGYLRAWRREIGLPWGYLIEFHGWWHLLTAVSAHLFIVMIDNLLEILQSIKKDA